MKRRVVTEGRIINYWACREAGDLRVGDICLAEAVLRVRGRLLFGTGLCQKGRPKWIRRTNNEEVPALGILCFLL